MIARQRGWTTAQHIHENNIPKVSTDCMEALRELDEWSWNGYQEKLAAKGYDLYLRKDKKDVIRGYAFSKAKRNSRHRTWKGAQPDRIPYQTDMGETASG